MKAGLGCGFALLLGVAAASIVQTVAWEGNVRSIFRAHEAIENVDALSLHARDAVDRARLFLKDGDQKHVAETWEELDSARVCAGRLSQFVSEDPSEQANVLTLRSLIDREYEVFANHSTAFEGKDVAKAIENYQRSGIVAEIDFIANRFRIEQYELLHNRSNDQAEAAKRMRILLLGASLTSFAVILLAFLRSRSDYLKRTAVERALATREEQYRQVVEDASDIICQTDAQGRFTFCNKTGLSTLHLVEAELLGRSYLRLIRHDRRRDAERFYLRQFIRRKKHTYYEFPLVDGNGRERWVGQNVQLVFEGERVTGFRAIVRDISERKRAEAELGRAKNFIEKIAATTPGILYVFDMEQQRNIFVNREMHAVLGYKRTEAVEMNRLMEILIHPDDLPSVRNHHALLKKAHDGEVFRLEFRARHLDGRWLWLASRDTPFERNPDGSVKQIIGIAQDVTQRRTVEEQLKYQANYDALTGLANRHHFFDRLDSTLRGAGIEHLTLSACIMDVDHFKAINDRYGHAAGDEVLQTVGEILRSEMRNGDITGRLGGDEFCIILIGAGVAEATSVADRVRDRLSTLAFGLGSGSPFSVTATIGVAQLTSAGESRELLELADEALYAAKNQGRNRTVARA